MKRSIIVGVIVISLPTLLAACGDGSSGGDSSEQGTLSGMITIGPACAAEPCSGPPGAIYLGKNLILLRSGAASFKVPLGEDGSFDISLEPSSYVIRMDGCNFIGCNDAFPMEKTIGAGETVTLNLDFDTGIRSRNQSGGIGVLVSNLVGLGSIVAQGDSISQPFFSVSGQEAIVDGETIQVFTYASSEDAQADAELVSGTGSPIGTTMVSWVEPPHFYLRDNLLVLYVGSNGAVVDRLQAVMGSQFAGVDPPSSLMLPQVNPAASPADIKVEEYLALMDNLAVALRRVSTSEDQQASIDQVLTIASQLEEYEVLFAALEEERRTQLFTAYGEQISGTAESAARLAAAAIEATGDESIAKALQRTPAFAIASTSTGGHVVYLGEPIIVVQAVVSSDRNISRLLSPDEVAALTGGLELTVQHRDQKSAADSVDPNKIEHIDSFNSLTFTTAEGSRGLSLTAMDFDSEDAAAYHLAKMTGPESGMLNMDDTIGDSSASLKVNQAGIGSMVAFKKGEWVVSLHTTQPDGDTPLVDLAELELLARTVADRL